MVNSFLDEAGAMRCEVAAIEPQWLVEQALYCGWLYYITLPHRMVFTDKIYMFMLCSSTARQLRQLVLLHLRLQAPSKLANCLVS